MIRLDVDNLSDVQRAIVAENKRLQAAAIRAINQAARDIKERLLVLPIALATGIPGDDLKRAIRQNNAKASNPEATLVPSSAGVLVTKYRYFPERTGADRTRSRIKVAWVDGLKTAAGFINELGPQGLPWRTRSSKGKIAPELAIGPSVAAAFKQMVDEDLRRDGAAILEARFKKYIERNL
jgi:hypothetical protein